MPALNGMTNVQKAKLISELLPEEIPAFLDYTIYVSDMITSDPDGLRKQWDYNNPIIGPQHWIYYAAEAKSIIEEHGNKLARSPKFFSDQLFDGMLALFTCHCIEQYAQHKCTNEKFKLAQQLIF